MDAENLRSFDLGDVFLRALNAYRRNAAPFLALSVVTVVPPSIFGHVVARDLRQTGTMPDPIDFVLLYGASIGGLLLLTSLVAWASGRDAAGATPELADYPRVLLRRALPLIATCVMVGLVVIAGMVACIVPGILAAVVLYVAVPAVMTETGGPFRAFSRSFDLTEGYRWYVFGIVVLLWIGDAVLGAPLSVAQAFRGPEVWSTALLATKSVVVMPFQAAVCGVSYERLRNVKEFTDADRLAEVFD